MKTPPEFPYPPTTVLQRWERGGYDPDPSSAAVSDLGTPFLAECPICSKPPGRPCVTTGGNARALHGARRRRSLELWAERGVILPLTDDLFGRVCLYLKTYGRDAEPLQTYVECPQCGAPGGQRACNLPGGLPTRQHLHREAKAQRLARASREIALQMARLR